MIKEYKRKKKMKQFAKRVLLQLWTLGHGSQRLISKERIFIGLYVLTWKYNIIICMCIC